MAIGTAERITRASKSNLALAFIALPRTRRRDISVFYAFCRVVDDLADEPGRTADERLVELAKWKTQLVSEEPHEPPLASGVRELIAKYALPVEHFHEIIAGCEMDVRGTIYETWDELRVYCHRVASVVGLVSIEIFGYTDPRCKTYATELGLALQLTNILRDVHEDYRNDGRIYLPRAEMDEFGYDVGRLALGVRDTAFHGLMEFQAVRAHAYFAAARAALPEVDRKAMIAAEIMRRVYATLLQKMQRDRFRIFTRRYRLSRWEKLLCVLAARFASVPSRA
jgi:phytoene synthase